MPVKGFPFPLPVRKPGKRTRKNLDARPRGLGSPGETGRERNFSLPAGRPDGGRLLREPRSVRISSAACLRKRPKTVLSTNAIFFAPERDCFCGILTLTGKLKFAILMDYKNISWSWKESLIGRTAPKTEPRRPGFLPARDPPAPGPAMTTGPMRNCQGETGTHGFPNPESSVLRRAAGKILGGSDGPEDSAANFCETMA